MTTMHELKNEIKALKDQLARASNQQSFFENVFKKAVDGMISIDERGLITHFNPASERLLGYSSEEVLGQNVSMIMPSPHAEDHDQYINRYLVTGIPRIMGQTHEVKAKHKDGRAIPVIISISEFSVGGVRSFIGILHDITIRKGMEKALSYSKQRFATIIENLPYGVLVEDQAGNLILVNQQFIEMFHIDMNPSDLRGIHSSQADLPPSHFFRKFEAYSMLKKNLVKNQTPSIGSMHELIDGRIILCDFIPIFSGSDPIGQLWQFRDVTTEKRAEYAQKESERLKTAILNTALDAILSIDENGLVVEWNMAATQLFGYSRTEAVGQSISKLIIPDHLRAGHEQGMTRLKQTGQSKILDQRLTLEARGKDGRLFPCELAITEVISEHRKLFTGFIRDISDRMLANEALTKAKESAESSNRAKSQFLARMSHEMRTPLNIILGTLELMIQDSAEGNPFHASAKTMKRSSDQLLMLINDFLDQSKIESGLLEIEDNPFRIQDLIQSICDMLAGVAETKGIAFDIQNHIPEDMVVVGDSRRISQILINLVSNSFKYTKEGSVSLSARFLEQPAPALAFEVKDTGLGIPVDEQAHIFQQFFQVDQGNQRQFGGSGLGLAICRSLAELMQGEVWLEHSEIGKGSIFRCNIPVKVGSNITAKQLENQFKNPESRYRSRILVIDDNEENLMLVRRFLEKMGHWVITRTRGNEVTHLLKNVQFDLVFMDLEMPECDGFGATQFIRDWEGRQHEKTRRKSLPIVALSAHALKDVQNRCLESGMNGFLSKPITSKSLQKTVHKHTDATRPLVLIVDPDIDSIHVLLSHVESSNFARGCYIQSAQDALDWLAKTQIELILLNYELDDMMGEEFIAKLRQFCYTTVLCYSHLDEDFVKSKMEAFPAVACRSQPLQRTQLLNELRFILNMSITQASLSGFKVQIDPELKDLATGYLENRRKEVQTFQTCLGGNDFPTIKRMGHNIKGTAGSYGFEELGKLGSELEKMAAKGDGTALQELVAQFERYVSQVQILDL